jgi:hypothetical protein
LIGRRRSGDIAVPVLIDYNLAVNKDRPAEKLHFWHAGPAVRTIKKDGQMPIFFLLNSLCVVFDLLLMMMSSVIDVFGESPLAVVGAD